MAALLIGIVAGAILSLIIIPEWAKPFIANLPEEPPTQERLLELFQDSLDTGETEIDSDFLIVACPNCGTPSNELIKNGFGDDYHGVICISCPNCDWSDEVDV